ncbi:MAG: xanthine dehydrogenase family protein molybdopterin-binding subunit [Actinomycetota bacterium]|nr:xanthine dehydrogenase family protein molybdopterin-binding subunit [Actinomycetota bacterium]
MSILGNAVLRREDPRFLTGEATYVGDVPLEGATHLVHVLSPIAHARIESIDTSEAAAAPGVLGVFTFDDLDLTHAAPLLPGLPEAMVRPYLAEGVVRFVGEPVVAIVAETVAQAEDAAEMVIVDYDPLPALVDPELAEASELVLFPDAGSNVVTRAERGEADLSGSEVVVEARFVNQRMAGAPIEPRVGAATWDGDRLVHWSSCQGAHPTRDALAKAYGLETDRVRVIVPDVGGGFGSKARAYPEEVMLGWYSRQLGRPVRWSETRSQNMTGLGHGRGQVQHVAVGGSRDGRIDGYRLRVVQDSGAYPMMGAFLPNMTMRMASGTYDIDHVAFESVAVCTNTTPVTAFRGAGRPEAAAAIERAIDLFAAEIGMDPVEVRRRNLLAPFDEPHRTPMGTKYDTGNYPAALDAAVEAAGYDELRATQARRRAEGDPKLMGIGVACYVEITAGAGGGEHGTAELLDDGRVRVVTGATPFGQGHDTTWAMIVAERLGVAMDAVEVVHGDTDLVPSGGITGGSRSAQIAGTAISEASRKLADAARRVAADVLEAAEDDVVLDADRGAFHVVGTPSVSASWADVAAARADEDDDDPLMGISEFAAAQGSFPFGAHIAVVEVDRETGHVELVRLVACDDAGTILNPVLAAGQIHGGIASGVGQALYEEIRFDDDGNPLTANFADYGVISAAELPSFERVVLETPTWLNELGAKGIGESGTIGATPAVQNAVVDALSHLGVRHLDLPCTPERVWRAIQAAED